MFKLLKAIASGLKSFAKGVQKNATKGFKRGGASVKRLPSLVKKIGEKRLVKIVTKTGGLALSATGLIGRTAFKAAKTAGAFGAGVAAGMLGGAGRPSKSSSGGLDTARDIVPIRPSIGADLSMPQEQAAEKSDRGDAYSIESSNNFYKQVLLYLKKINNNVGDLEDTLNNVVEKFNLQAEEAGYEKVTRNARPAQIKAEKTKGDTNLAEMMGLLSIIGISAFPEVIDKLSNAYNDLAGAVSEGFAEVSSLWNEMSTVLTDVEKAFKNLDQEFGLAAVGGILLGWKGALAGAIIGSIGDIFDEKVKEDQEKSGQYQRNREVSDKSTKNIITSKLISSGLIRSNVDRSTVENWVNQLPPAERDSLSADLTAYEITPVAPLEQKILTKISSLNSARPEGARLTNTTGLGSEMTPEEFRGEFASKYSNRPGAIQESTNNSGMNINTATRELGMAEDKIENESVYIDNSQQNINTMGRDTKNTRMLIPPTPDSTVNVNNFDIIGSSSYIE